MKTSHTAGPWHVGMRPGPIIYGPKGEMVADMRCGEMLPENEALANMRLIASCPDLLNALEIAEATIQRLAPDGSRATQGTLSVISEALKKAKGAE